MPDVLKKSDERAADRLIFFSDAVVAIAITLLALDLPVPEQPTTKAFLNAIHENRNSYLAFAISFVVIAVAWSHHHDIFRYAERVDRRLRQLNAGWLLMIILTPFATRLLTTRQHDVLFVHALKFGFYAVLQALAATLVLAMIHHMTSADLLEPGSPPADRWRLGVLRHDPRLRAVHTCLLSHHQWLAGLGHRPVPGQAGEKRP